MRRLPPVGSIQAFVSVARLGSLKAAADALALSSPALTRRIQALEQFVGRTLLERAHNGIQLNEAGKSFFTEVAPHIDAMSRAVERISAPGKGMRLRIAVPSLLAAQRLLPVLPSLRALHPTLQIDVDTGANRLARLAEEDIDAVIALTDRVDDRYYARLLQRGRVMTIGARSLKEGPDAIREPGDLKRVQVLLHRDMPTSFEHWRQQIGMPDLEPAGISHFDAGQLILDAAAEGLGVAFMLDSHMAHSHDERLVQMFDQTIESPYSYWFVCLPDALKRKPVRAFHDWLVEQFADTVEPVGGRVEDKGSPAQETPRRAVSV